MRNHPSFLPFFNIFLFLIYFLEKVGFYVLNLLEWHGISYFPFGGKGEKLERAGGGREKEKEKEKERKKGMNNNVRFSFLIPKIL